MSQKLRIGIAAVVMIAACSDQGSGPVAPVARATTPFSVGAGNPADQGKVTIVRTTEVRAPDQSGVADGAPPRMLRRQKTISMGTGRVTLRREDARMQAALKATPIESVTSVDDLPLAGLSFPAGMSSLRRSIVPWQHSSPIPGEPGGFIELSGTGDAPASTIKYVRNGVTAVVVEQEWELWKRQWNLVRRVTSTPDGGLNEVIAVSRTGQTGTAVESPLEWTQGAMRLGASPASFDIFGEAEEDCDPCLALRKNALEAMAVSLAKDALAVVACAFAPLGLTIPVCTAALGVATEALIKAVRAASDLIDCEANKPPCPKKDPPITDCSRRGAGAHRLAPSFECGSSTDGGTTGASGTGGTGSGETTSSGHYECTYYYEYDLDTGDILYSELLYCSWVGGP